MLNPCCCSFDFFTQYAPIPSISGSENLNYMKPLSPILATLSSFPFLTAIIAVALPTAFTFVYACYKTRIGFANPMDSPLPVLSFSRVFPSSSENKSFCEFVT
jgi:hypothetical protein